MSLIQGMYVRVCPMYICLCLCAKEGSQNVLFIYFTFLYCIAQAGHLS